MAPYPGPTTLYQRSVGTGAGSWRLRASDEDFVLESWSQGFMVGALIIMGCITVANMRRGVLLHKLILAEQLLAMSHGTFCFMAFRGYGWYLSSTASLLYCSWIIHNIVAWMKIRPFFCDPRSMFKARTGRWVKRIYLSTLACTVPPIVLQIFDNFRFFNNINGFYTRVRPYEPLFRDPWWVFTCITLFHVIRRCYGTSVVELIQRSPRFGILLCAICLAMIFTVADIVASIHSFTGTTDGINPWWKLSLVFKCLTDTIMLDDFKTELKRLGIRRIQAEETRRHSVALVKSDVDDVDEVEFSDAASPSRHMSRVIDNNETINHQSSPSPSSRDRNRDLHQERAQIGRGGIKISRLPALSLNRFAFAKTKSSHAASPVAVATTTQNDDDHEIAPRDRLSRMRQSLGLIDYAPQSRLEAALSRDDAD